MALVLVRNGFFRAFRYHTGFFAVHGVKIIITYPSLPLKVSKCFGGCGLFVRGVTCLSRTRLS